MSNKLPKKFPSIYRSITESKLVKSVRNRWIRLLNQPKVKKSIDITSISLILFISLVLLYEIGVSSLVFYIRLTKTVSLVSEREKLISQVNFWSSIADKYDGYKDAYFQMGLLEYKLSDFNKAKTYNDIALLLDPNDKNARNLGRILGTK